MVTVLVSDFNDTIDFYTHNLDFEIDFDNKLEGSDRWIVLKHKENEIIKLSLKLALESEKQLIGNQTGSQSFININIEDLNDYFKKLEKRKVVFERVSSPYADYAYLTDNNGNKITLSEYWINDW